MQWREGGVVALQDLASSDELVCRKRFQDLDDPGCCECGSCSTLAVEGEFIDTVIAHRRAQVTLDEGVDQNSEIAKEREWVDALVGLQVERDEVDHALQDVVAVLDAGLSLHGEEQLGIGHRFVVCHYRPAAVEAGIVRYHVFGNHDSKREALFLDAHLGGIQAETPASGLSVLHDRLGGDNDVHPSLSPRLFDAGPPCSLDRLEILQATAWLFELQVELADRDTRLGRRPLLQAPTGTTSDAYPGMRRCQSLARW